MQDSNIAIKTSQCLACGRCVDRCIMDNLRLMLPPCRQASALGVNYQGVFRLAAKGTFAEAARELRRSTPFGGLLAALGDTAASHACSRGKKGGALDFAGLLSFLARTQEEIVYEPERKLPRSAKKAAVLGSGFAALQAAYSLRLGGHAVSVFNFSLAEQEAAPEAVAQKTLGMLAAMGITFEQNNADRVDWKDACAAYDAVLLTTRPAGLAPDTNGQAGEKLFAMTPSSGEKRNLLRNMAEAARVAHAARNLLEGFAVDYESDERTARGLERFRGLSEAQEDAPNLAPAGREGDVYTEAEARAEAARCLGCGRPVERNQTCWYCLPCEVVCPVGALHVRIPYLIR